MNRYKARACGTLLFQTAVYRINGLPDPTHKKKQRRINWLRALIRLVEMEGKKDYKRRAEAWAEPTDKCAPVTGAGRLYF